jgi:hypothetical protein
MPVEVTPMKKTPSKRGSREAYALYSAASVGMGRI